MAQQPEPELHPEALKGKRVVICVANPYMKDDGIGTSVASELRKLDLGSEVFVYDYQAMDLAMLSYFQHASKVIIVDALKSNSAPGTVSKYSVTSREDPFLKLPNLHELQLFDIMDIANNTGVLPHSSVIIGIEPKDCTFGEGLTERVAAAVPIATAKVVEELKSL